MTVCYPLTVQADYTELLYSLRSIERFLPDPYEVIIIGIELPEWITGVTQISLPDVKGRKQLSIKTKIAAALAYSDEILFMNDDVYLLEPATTFPYYQHGSLKSVGEGGARPLMTELQSMGKATKNFDGHYPLIYKRDFLDAMSNFTADTIIKSAYCNYLSIEGIEVADNKLINQKKPEDIMKFIKDKSAFSTGPHSLPATLPILQQLYPTPSRFEI